MNKTLDISQNDPIFGFWVGYIYRYQSIVLRPASPLYGQDGDSVHKYKEARSPKKLAFSSSLILSGQQENALQYTEGVSRENLKHVPDER